jgi:hypothetical protein
MHTNRTQYALNVGALFKNTNRKTDKAPILTGLIELDRELVTHLYRQLQNGQGAKVSLGGWRNISKTGTAYFTIKASKPFVPQESGMALEDDDDDFDL